MNCSRPENRDFPLMPNCVPNYLVCFETATKSCFQPIHDLLIMFQFVVRISATNKQLKKGKSFYRECMNNECNSAKLKKGKILHKAIVVDYKMLGQHSM